MKNVNALFLFLFLSNLNWLSHCPWVETVKLNKNLSCKLITSLHNKKNTNVYKRLKDLHVQCAFITGFWLHRTHASSKFRCSHLPSWAFLELLLHKLTIGHSIKNFFGSPFLFSPSLPPPPPPLITPPPQFPILEKILWTEKAPGWKDWTALIDVGKGVSRLCVSRQQRLQPNVWF